MKTNTFADLITTNPYMNNDSTSIIPPYWYQNNYPTSASGYTISTSPIKSSNIIDDVLSKIPILCKVVHTKIVEKNKLQIIYNKIMPNNFGLKFLPQTGTLYFGHGIFGVYSNLGNQYWNDVILVEFENLWKTLLFVRKGTIFTSANNFDEGITNEEIALFVKKPNKYVEYIHSLLENEMSDKDTTTKYQLHKELDIYLKYGI